MAVKHFRHMKSVDFVGPESNQAVPDGYAGFNWSDGTTAPPTALSFPGVANVFSHGTVVFETPSPLGADSGSNFNLTSLQFSTGGVTGVRITGYENGALKYTSQVIDLNGTDLDHMATAELNWTGIDKVQIDVISGSGVGNVWYMDNIAIGENMGVDFEGVDTVPLVNGYGGLNWDSSNGVLAGLTPDIYGYDTNDFSGGQLFDIAPTNEIAWNAGAGQNTVISAINPADNFTFVSLDLINDQRPLGWGANQLRITGYDGTSAIETADITLTESLTTHVFNWEGIDSIHIDVIGGTFQGDQTAISSGFWGMDNLIVV
jgi:hypothetical protein